MHSLQSARPEPIHRRRSSAWPRGIGIVELGVAFLLLLAITLFLQIRSGTYQTDMATVFPDEAPHFVNSVLVQQYLLHGLGRSPIQFARNFYLALPKVSIGHWPPMFYAFSGTVMALTSATKATALLISATITTALALAVAAIVRHRQGAGAGLLAGVAFAILPIIRESAMLFMVDACLALMMLIATVICVRLIETLRAGWAIAFAVVASLAILTKGNALALALLPPVLVVLKREWHALRSSAFWLPLPIVGLLCGPWLLLTYHATAVGFGYNWGLAYSWTALAANSVAIIELVGPVGVALACLGGYRALRNPAERPLSVGLIGIAIAVLVFQCVVPAALDRRYLIPVVAALFVLAIDAIADIGRMLAGGVASFRRASMPVVAALVLAAAIPAVAGPDQPHVNPNLGMIPAARDVLANDKDASSAVLIGSDSGGEGAFIAAIAPDAPRRGIIVARGFKLLATDNFDGTAYRPRFASAAQVGAAVERLGISLVVLDTRPRSLSYRHNEQLLRAAHDRDWRLVGRFAHSGPGETLVFAVTGHAPLDRSQIAALEQVDALGL